MREVELSLSLLKNPLPIDEFKNLLLSCFKEDEKELVVYIPQYTLKLYSSELLISQIFARKTILRKDNEERELKILFIDDVDCCDEDVHFMLTIPL